MRVPALLAASLIGCGVCPAHAANLIVNGGFEQPAQPAAGYTLVPTGSAFEGWTVIGAPGNVAPVSGAYASGPVRFPAHGGAQWLDLTGLSNTPTGIQQSVQTVPGTQYDLSFFVGNVVGGGWGSASSVEVLVNGRSLGIATNSLGAGLNRQVWKRFHYSFTAHDSSTTVAFLNRDPPTDNTNGLDDVSLLTHAEALASCQGATAGSNGGRFLGKLAALAGGALAAAQRAGGTGSGAQVLTAVSEASADAADEADECNGSATVEAGAASAATPAPGAGSAAQLTPPAPSQATLAQAQSHAARSAPAGHAGTASNATGAVAPETGNYESLVTSDAPPSVPTGPAKAPPDIGGLRLGMSPEEAHAALVKRYPGHKIDVSKYEVYLPNGGGTRVATVLESFSVGLNELVAPEDRIRVLFTPPPAKPVVFAVSRNLIRQKLYRANVIASLREKYGRESFANLGDGTATDDSQVHYLTWVFDRQGHVSPAAPPGGADVVERCLRRASGQSMFTYDSILQPGHTEAQLASDLTVSPWCTSSGIIVRADIPPGEIVGSLDVRAIDNPTVESGMRAEGEWLRKLTAARNQQDIDATKQSKPNL